MILSNLSDTKNYTYLNTSFRKALNFLKKNDFSKFINGRYEIDGDRIYAMVNEYNPKTFEDILWEAHDQYADIHYICVGEERIGISDINKLEKISEYIPEKDATFYKGTGQFISLKKGEFMIIFPKEPHVTGLVSELVTKIKKIVVKVRIYNEK